MKINLTSKEKSLLKDQKSHEEICVQKYTYYANAASDPQLKALFNNHAQTEQEHLNTINQLLNGEIPDLNQQQGNAGANQQPLQGYQQEQANIFPLTNNPAPNVNNQSADKNLCADLLMTEKYVSGTYDTAIFEFRDPQVRDTLNHIQKEEQKHGEAIFNYMESKGMYSPQ